MCTDFEYLNIFTIAFKTFRRTTLPPTVVDWNNFAAEFYHLKVKNIDQGHPNRSTVSQNTNQIRGVDLSNEPRTIATTCLCSSG